MFSPAVLAQLHYINLETYRKNGVAVRTPVWFIMENDALYVQTEADSGKVKRIRKNSRVQVAPCKMDGAVTGEWQPAEAHEVLDEETVKKVDRMLGKKYGLMKGIFALGAVFLKRKYTILEIKGKEER